MQHQVVHLDVQPTFLLTCEVCLNLDLRRLDHQQPDPQVGHLGWMDHHQAEWALVLGQQQHR